MQQLERIGAHKLGGGPFVIAEAGVNHNGSYDEARRLVDIAFDAGADAVKFQMFRATELVTEAAPVAAYQQRTGDTSQQALLAKLELPRDAFAQLNEHCAARGIAFLATPFGFADLAALRGLRPPAIKIASPDLGNVPLLRAAASTGLPLLISTGAADGAEIKATVGRLRDWAVLERSLFLHCVSAYPTPTNALNLRALARLAQLTETPVGLSDHSTSVQTGAWAVCCGAVVLEKHFTRDPSADGPDHAVSLDAKGLRDYIAAARAAHAALGDGVLRVAPLEEDVRQAARRSIVAKHALRAGARLTPNDLAVKRPAGGIDPGDWDGVIGRTLRVALEADQPLAWEHLE